jgi:hypothetical protein
MLRLWMHWVDSSERPKAGPAFIEVPLLIAGGANERQTGALFHWERRVARSRSQAGRARLPVSFSAVLSKYTYRLRERTP